MAMQKNKKNLIFTKTFSCTVLPGACTMALRLNARTSAQLVLRRAEVDACVREGTATGELQRRKELERESRNCAGPTRY